MGASRNTWRAWDCNEHASGLFNLHNYLGKVLGIKGCFFFGLKKHRGIFLHSMGGKLWALGFI